MHKNTRSRVRLAVMATAMSLGWKSMFTKVPISVSFYPSLCWRCCLRSYAHFALGKFCMQASWWSSLEELHQKLMQWKISMEIKGFHGQDQDNGLRPRHEFVQEVWQKTDVQSASQVPRTLQSVSSTSAVVSPVDLCLIPVSNVSITEVRHN